MGVYNFVTQGADGYIIMEYVGGKTLKTIRKERGGPLPVAEAIAYIHRILLAFGYLHRLGLVYCDFKPDNFMVEGDDVKLIDMGGVRRIDDVDGDIYGTKGYSAPEAGDGPTFTTDLYTVARTLAVLLMDFPFQGGKHEFFLPSPSEQAVLAQNESLYRLLIKATHKDPDERFQTADEMAAQLIGVLRETVSFDGTPRPVESTVFGGDNVSLADLEAPDARVLPVPKPDAQDPAAGAILSAASLTDPDQVAALFERAMAQFPESVEAPLLLAHARINQNRYAEAEKLLKDAEALDPFDWQITWLRGLSRMMQNKTADAKAAFDKVYGEVPGELAPKLALAFAAEQTGDMAAAIRFYEIVVRTDPSFTSAAFGLARCRIKTKDRAGAIAAYNRIPTASRLHVPAQMALARVLVQTELSPPGVAELEQASNAITGISIDGYLLHQLSVEVLRAAIHQVEAKAIPTGTSGKVLGQPLQSRALREAVEKELRAMARHAKTRDEKIDLIDAANRERPRTLV